MGNKRTCGIIVPSSCMPWVGGELQTFSIQEICDPSAEEVILGLDNELQKIKDTLNTDNIFTGCYMLPSSASWYDIASQVYSELCSIKEAISLLRPQVVNVGAAVVPVNMECMTGTCAPTPLNITQLFEMLINKVCTLESRLNEIAPSNSINGNLLFQPT